MIAQLAHFGLFIFAFTVSSLTGPVSAERVSRVVEDVTVVASEEAPLFDGPDGREQTARLLLVWWDRENPGWGNQLGDHGLAVGPLQVHRYWMAPDVAEMMEHDDRVGLRVGLGLMRAMRKQCGSISAGLSAYASGRCAGAAQLVRARCAAAGVPC